MKRLPFALVALLTSFGVFRASAATVTSLADDGPGSLREAIALGGDIDFGVTGTITLTSGPLVINHSVAISGPGADQLTIARSSAPGTPEFRVLTVNGNAALSGVTLTSGQIGTTDGYEDGGGVLVKGALTLRNCAVTGNRSVGGWTRGTGICVNNGGRLTALNCLFARNSGSGFSSEGSAIYNYGALALTNCTFSGNSAGYSAAIQNDAFSDGIEIDSCTIFGNTARFAPALMNGVNAAMLLRNSIVAGNSAWDGDWEIESRGHITSAGYNLLGFVYHGPGMDPVPPHPTDRTNLPGSALRLAPLANNGGPTQTHALLTNSPAFNAGPTNSFPATDQRGVERPQHARADIGAFEAQTFGPAPTNHPPVANAQIVTAHIGTPLPITLTGSDPDGDTLTYSITTLPVWGMLSGTPPDVIYTPATNSPDWDHFAFKVNDGQADSASAGVNVMVLPTGPRPLPDLGFRLAFNNPNHTAGVFFQDYTLNGPVSGTLLLPADRVVPDRGGRYYYGAKPHQMWRVDSQTGAIQQMDPGPGLPELSWPMAVAFDSHRNRVLLASLGGEGFLYAYSPSSNQWGLLRSMENRDVDCLEYHASQDALYGVSVSWGGGPATIYRFSADGAFQGEISLPYLPFRIGPGGYWSELVSVGDYLVLLLEADPVYDAYGESRIYLIDPRNGDVRLTYQKVRPRPNLPPTVQINSPTDGQLFSAPAQIQLVAYAQDPEENFNLTVEFFEGTNSLGFGTFVPSLCPAPYCPNFALTWSNVPPGQYTLTAKARDSAGAVAVSPPVRITVYDPALSIVTLRATDASASETGDTGTFTVHRDGNTNEALTVYYSIGGTASNGVDYVALEKSVNLPAGIRTATILVVPIDDSLAEGSERVELRLVPPPVLPSPYVIVSPSNAVVTLSDNEPPPPRPVVTIKATDPLASEAAGDLGQFTVYRTGPTNEALSVFCAFGGTASNGEDYTRLPNTLVIPAGSESAAIAVAPIDDALGEGTESVVATLYYPPIPGPFPPPYVIGSPSNAVVTIQDNDPAPTNPPPFVRIFSPTNGGTFTAPANIGICAIASDYVATVELFAGDRSLGILTNYCLPPVACFVAPTYCLVWSNVPGGLYTLTARATDIFGASSVSDAVHISVDPSPDPHQPVVTIAATDAHASEPVMDPGVFTVYRSGNTSATLHVQYRIEGTASNGRDYGAISNGVVIPAGEISARVLINPLHDNLAEAAETVTLRLLDPVCIAIFPPPPDCYRVGAPSAATVSIADTNHPPTVGILTPTNGARFTAPANIKICGGAFDPDGYWTTLEFFADATSVGIWTNPCPRCINVVAPVYCVSWINVPPGEYILTAKTVDEKGAIGISRPVNIRVIGTNPPSANLPIVTIAAPDSLASEGTNCYRWPGWPTPLPSSYSGTNTATFVVRRTGPTNTVLTVYYRIGGTASNGVDYGALPGVVTIPAGQRAANFTIVPLDDALHELIETVVLTLGLPPDPTHDTLPYQIGFPARAAAIIVDNDHPRPVTGALPDRCFHVMRPGSNGTWWRIECSTDLAHWTLLSTNLVTDGALHFVDPDAAELTRRFYRAVPETNPPAQ